MRAWLLPIGLLFLAASAQAVPIGPFPEDEGSIPLASNTGLVTGASVEASGTIGDGPFGTSGTGSGDFDFFRIGGVLAGQVITVDIDADIQSSSLDSFIALYNSSGSLVASNDDDGATLDSYLEYGVTAADDYFLSIGSYNSETLSMTLGVVGVPTSATAIGSTRR